MNRLIATLPFAFLSVSPAAHAFPGAGPGSQLSYSAHTLSLAAEEFQQILSSRGCTAHLAGDAETLFLATEHFEEEVNLGPQDLDVDFATIERQFEDIRADVMNANEVRTNPDFRTAWFQVEESNIRLRQAWLDGGSVRGF